MLQGKYFSENNDSGVLTVNNKVVDKLREKHPTPGDIAENSLLNGPLPQTPASYFDNIIESTIRKAATIMFINYWENCENRYCSAFPQAI